MVQQTELANQSSKQGTYKLSQECRLNLDAPYSCLLLHLVSILGLRYGNPRKAMYVNSSPGTRVSVDQICRDY